MSNIKEFKELIERYESITLEEIEKAKIEVADEDDPRDFADLIAHKLTGYGSAMTCTLCLSSELQGCNGCYYTITKAKHCGGYQGLSAADEQREAFRTSYAIGKASTSEELLKAFKERAAFMRKLM